MKTVYLIMTFVCFALVLITGGFLIWGVATEAGASFITTLSLCMVAFGLNGASNIISYCEAATK